MVKKVSIATTDYDEMKLHLKEYYALKTDAIKKRFPNAKFGISCFNTIDDIETRILCISSKKYIIYNGYFNEKYLIKINESGILYFKEIIDQLIDQNLNAKNEYGDHKYLENITLCYDTQIENINAYESCGSFWGS